VRLFVAFRPPPTAIRHAAGAVDRITSTAPDLRWIPPERWHVTCAFLGDVAGSDLDSARVALNELAPTLSGVEGVRLRGSGTFPGVVWLGVSPADPGSPLAELVDALAGALHEAVPTLPKRTWRGHITIARWRSRGDADRQAAAASGGLREYVGPPFDIHEVSLVQSVTGPDPAYVDLHTVTLGCDPDGHRRVGKACLSQADILGTPLTMEES
jgi:RNA 2',3'-cyclic 3'-phosphodiesterase